MDKTPKAKSRFVRSNDYNSTSNASPMKEAKKQRFWNHDGDSQETNDVLWDWDSPKNIRPKALRVKRREIHKSPILAPKKTSQNDHMKNYEKLKQELQALRDEIASTDDCLPLSPVDEQIFREENENSEINSFIEEQYFHIENQEIEAGLKTESKQNTKECVNQPIDELFNDDCDEQLFLCSQMIEEKLDVIKSNKDQYYKVNENNKIDRNDINKNIKHVSDLNSNGEPGRKSNSKHKSVPDHLTNWGKSLQERPIDDSFDEVLLEFEDEDIEILSQTNKHRTLLTNKFQSKNASNSSFKRTISDANVQYTHNKPEKFSFDKTAFHRTQSFESTSALKNNDNLPQHVMEEIERKRKEALAKLMEKKEKRLPMTPTKSNIDNNAMKCSPDEIEKKRLQAKAIREAKQREIIEKNRQEAMKRLEMNRRKRQENSKYQEKKT